MLLRYHIEEWAREGRFFVNYIMLSHVLRDFEIQDDYGNCVVAVCALQLLHTTDDAPVFVGSIKQFGGIECRKILTVCIKNIIAWVSKQVSEWVSERKNEKYLL